MIDLRSDTVTKPTPAMLAAMAAAEVGDEQEREDPTTNELQRRAAELLGHEAALFLPTATMANQVALRVLSRPGCKVVAEERTHTLIYEWGGPAIHSGLVMQGLPAEAGRVTPAQIRELEDFGPGGVLVLENTHRGSGARVWPLEHFRAAVDTARERGAAVHLDGARLFNASIAAGLPPSAWASLADSVTVCFSKGLGCPLGAVLAGSAAFVEEAWQGKFLFGGALRQSGVVAAAMLYALDHNVDRLAEDHERARRLAEGLHGAGVPVDLDAVETNFVGIEHGPLGLTEAEAIARAREQGVLLGDLRPGVLRAATHLDVSGEDVERAIELIPQALGARTGVSA
ncbi:MAG TPA: GntG family PLP-dependent aldolase [Gaiellaceae bacterium]|nr:GntG family PLP-dependent aldolase [Gaiellaceae bacterium]